MNISTKQLSKIEALSGKTITKCQLYNKLGNLSVSVENICDGKPIKDVLVKANRIDGITNSNGLSGFMNIQPDSYNVEIYKHFINEDYITFITHYPSNSFETKAEVTSKSSAIVRENQTTKLNLKVTIFRTVESISLLRRNIDLFGKDMFGHWWTEISETESYGWWPKGPIGTHTSMPLEPTPLGQDASIADQIRYRISYSQYLAKMKLYESGVYKLITETLGGVEGELNGTSFGGKSNKDYHHGDWYDERFQPVINDCRTNSDINSEIRTFVRDFVSNNKEWSWRFEFGTHCHSFQIDLMKKCSLEKVKSMPVEEDRKKPQKSK